MRRISRYVSDWTIQFFYLFFDHSCMMHASVVKNENLIRLQMIQVMLKKLANVLACYWTFHYLRSLKASNGDGSKKSNVFPSIGRHINFGLFSFRSPAIMSSSLQPEDSLIEEHLFTEWNLLYHPAVILPIDYLIT